MDTLAPLPITKTRLRGPWVEVDLRILEDNIRKLKGALRPGAELMFVIKANAYGHGLVPMAARAAQAGVRWFAVAYAEEAVRLRQAGLLGRILVMGVVDPAEVPALLEHDILPIVASEKHGMQLAAAARALGARLPVHLKVDTGMMRLGIPWEEAVATHARLGAERGLDIQGLCSHFATVQPGAPSPADTQFARFAAALDAGKGLFRHLSSSRACLYHPEWDYDGVRVGIALYGYGTRERGMRVKTRPILQWKTTVVQVKKVPANAAVGYYGTYVTPAPTTIAVAAVGYADGYLRALSNRGLVLIRGRKHKVVGRVSMNWLTVDVGADTSVCEGDEVVLVGEQGGESIWADKLAAQCRTIAYEILTGINPAVERVYVR